MLSRRLVALNKERAKFGDWAVGGLVLLVLFHVAANVLWLQTDNALPGWDESGHSWLTVRHAEYLTEGGFRLTSLLRISDYYPPLVYLSTIPLHLLNPDGWKVLRFSGTAYFGLALIFLFLYSSRFFENRLTALFATTSFGFFITVVQESRRHMLDIPLTAAVLVAVYLLELTRARKDRLFTWFFVLSLAIGQLVKWYFFVFLLVPILFRARPTQTSQRLPSFPTAHGLFASAVALVVAAPWYLLNIGTFVGLTSLSSWQGEPVDPQNLLSAENLLFHLRLVIQFQTGLVGFLIFIGGLVTMFWKRSGRRWELLSILVWGYFFFTFIPNKNIRYLMPLMPFTAMPIGFGLKEMISTRSQLTKSLGVIIMGYMLLTYSVLSFGVPFEPEHKYAVKLPILGWIDVYYFDTYPVNLLWQAEHWPQDEIIDAILEHNNDATVYVGYDVRHFNRYNIRLLTHLHGRGNLRCLPLPEERYFCEEDYMVYLGNVDCALIPALWVSEPNSEWLEYYDGLVKIQDYFLEGMPSGFQVIGEYPTPDGNPVLLFARDITVDSAEHALGSSADCALREVSQLESFQAFAGFEQSSKPAWKWSHQAPVRHRQPRSQTGRHSQRHPAWRRCPRLRCRHRAVRRRRLRPDVGGLGGAELISPSCRLDDLARMSHWTKILVT